MEKENTKQYIVSMTPTLYQKATLKAKALGLSFAAYVRTLLIKDEGRQPILLENQTGSNAFFFNTSSHIFVKMKPEGFVLWKEAVDRLNPGWPMGLSDYEAQADEEGYVGFMVSHFFTIFGSELNRSNPPFDPLFKMKGNYAKD